VGELLKALIFGRAVRGLITDAELLAATAVLERDDGHTHSCGCELCSERFILDEGD